MTARRATRRADCRHQLRLGAKALVLVIATFAAAPAAGAVSYVARPLLPPVDETVVAKFINRAGQVAVTHFDASAYGSTALRVDRDGSVRVIGPPGSQPIYLMPDGRAVLVTDDPARPGALIWGLGEAGGAFTSLRSPTGFEGQQFAVQGVSDGGAIIGSVGTYGALGANAHAVTVWGGPSLDPVVIGRVGGLPTSPLAISSAGSYIVGETGTNDGGPNSTGVTKPFVYHNGTFTTIDVPGYDWAQATAVNESGEVFGWANR